MSGRGEGEGEGEEGLNGRRINRERKRGRGAGKRFLVFGAGTAYSKLFGFRSWSTSMCLKAPKNGARMDGVPPPPSLPALILLSSPP